MKSYSGFLSDDGFAIFLFHGVIRRQRHEVRNYTRKHILLDRFVFILRDLVQNGTPVSMPEIVKASAETRSLPERAFAVTFDDGFENNYSIAAPVLEEFRVPATFYVTTRFIEEGACSWIDMIESAVDGQEEVRLRLPALDVNGRYATREDKLELLEAVRQYVKNHPQVDPYAFAQEVWDQSSLEAMELDPELDGKMSWEQLRELNGNPSFTVGGHGHTHRILEFLDDSEMEDEVATSLGKLRGNLGPAVVHYSYPEGLWNCYSQRVIRRLRRHGIVCAPSAENGINHPGDDLFHLKRILVT